METDDQCLLGATWVDLLSLNLGASAPTSKVRPPTGEPDAGNPPVRFGGRGEVLSLVPTPIQQLWDARATFRPGIRRLTAGFQTGVDAG